HGAAVAVRATLDLAVELGHDLVRRRPVRERMPVRPVRRRDHVAVLERAADADGSRLLAERDVQEARQLTSPEALLHLLLESPDEEHVPEELEQALARDFSLAFHLGHRPEFMLGMWGWSTSGGQSRAGSRITGRTPDCCCGSKPGTRPTAPRRSSRRSMPAGSSKVCA